MSGHQVGEKVIGQEGLVRVLRIISRMNVGGPAWQVSVLTRGLDQNRFQSLLLAGELEDGEGDFLELRDPDLPVTKIPVLRRSIRLGDDLRALVAIRRAIKQLRPDIVHTHTAKAGLLGRLAAVTCRVPLRVHTFHGHLLHGYFGPATSRMLLTIERVLARRTTALVAVGQQVRNDLIQAKVGRLSQYTVIPPGVEKPEVLDKASARVQLGLPVEGPIILFVGRLTAIKRPDRLIKAMELVLEHRPDAVLGVVGEGELLTTTERLAEPLGPAVRFLGWQPDIAALYAAADCVVLTSDSEGMPVTLIEAAFAGVPGVTTDVGSAGEVVLDGLTGLVVEANAEAVANGLILILENDLCFRMGEAAKERAEAVFSTTRLVSAHEALYRNLITGQAALSRQANAG